MELLSEKDVPEGLEWAHEPPSGDSTFLFAFRDGKLLKKYDISGDAVTTIGRNGELADIEIEHMSLSRIHVAIARDSEGKVYLFDMGSTHGTFIGNRKLPVRERELLPASTNFRLGECPILFVVEHAETVSRDNNISDPVLSTSENTAGSSMPPPPSLATGLSAIEIERKKRNDEISAAIASFSKPPTYSAVPRTLDDLDKSVSSELSFELPESFTKSTKRIREEESVDSTTVDKNSSSSEIANPFQLPVTSEAVLSVDAKNVSSVCTDPAGARVFCGTPDGKLILFDFTIMNSSLQMSRSCTPFEGHPVLCIASSNRGDRVAVSCGTSQIVLTDRSLESTELTIRGDPYLTDIAQTKGHVGEVTCLAFHPAFPDILFSGSIDGSVRIWDTLDISANPHALGPNDEAGRRIFDELVCRDVLRVRTPGSGSRAHVTSLALITTKEERRKRIPSSSSQLNTKAGAGPGLFQRSPINLTGDTLMVGTSDGYIHEFRLRGAGHRYTRPDSSIHAHPSAVLALQHVCAAKPGGEGVTSGKEKISGLNKSDAGGEFASEFLASRDADGVLHLWRLPLHPSTVKTPAPAGTLYGLLPQKDLPLGGAAPQLFGVGVSPDGRFLAVPTCALELEGRRVPSRVALVSVGRVIAAGEDGVNGTLDAEIVVPLGEGARAPTAISWPSATNQLICASSGAAISVIYDSQLSSRGVLAPLARTDTSQKREKRRMEEGFVGELTNPEILLPGQQIQASGRHRPSAARVAAGGGSGDAQDAQEAISRVLQAPPRTIGDRIFLEAFKGNSADSADSQQALLRYQQKAAEFSTTTAAKKDEKESRESK